MRERLYLSTIDPKAGSLARRYGLGVEIASFCTARNMDEGLSEAEEALNKIGLKLGSVSYVEDSESLPNTVISQSVNTDVELVLGDEIDVEVSRSSKGD